MNPQLIAQIIILIISIVVAYANRPKQILPDAATLDDFDFPTAEEGRPIPVIFGTVWYKAPNVIWYGELGIQAIKKKSGK